MPKPPEAPPSSDIEGVDRDAGKSSARGKPADPEQQHELARADRETVARPNYDADASGEENAQ